MIEEAAGTRMYECKKITAHKTIEKKESKLDEIRRVGLYVGMYALFSEDADNQRNVFCFFLTCKQFHFFMCFCMCGINVTWVLKIWTQVFWFVFQIITEEISPTLEKLKEVWNI